MTISRESSSRRSAICDAALELAARGGNHAVTHQGIDTHLGLPKGSTSYYFRTRHALVSAAITHLTERSRADFAALRSGIPEDGPPDPARPIATYLERLLTRRRNDVLARYALATDAQSAPELAAALSTCMFSVSAATDLMRDLGAHEPEAAARDLVTLLEGVVFDYTHGTRAHTSSGPRASRSEDIRSIVGRWIDTLRATR
ncbi:TetR/AcrR family transcriptional regulator [Rhodococcus sp. CH91]|uniref:TetR/AcrR family transcriptional regulator n=1 Tax=Rhodococcus sp. CH91 TaxID=2910256 RepID=UPI001F4ADB40|nr:TetR/AcrR family transcriptional regulator [Rhodococcus sp. CH91]